MANLDEPIQFPHEFVIDLYQLVTLNHSMTLEAIDRQEEQEIAKLSDEADEAEETYRSIVNHMGTFFEDLRRAANNLAVVAIVIRLDHWINRFVTTHEAKLKPIAWKDSRLVTNLGKINQAFGNGPISLDVFAELVNVRDSVVHGDGRSDWIDHHGKLRVVDKRYVNSYGDVAVSKEQVDEAAKNAITRVECYDQRE